MKYASIRLLGILGGLAGILIGTSGRLLEMIFWGHFPGSWVAFSLISPEISSLFFILLGIIGVISSLLYSERRREMARVITASGLLGFPIGFVSGSYLTGSWIFWIIPGTLLTTAGCITLGTFEKIASSLPLVKSDKREIRLLGNALYSGLFIIGIFFLMAILIFASIVFIIATPPTPPSVPGI
jgi:hypothetical protein